MSGTRVFRLPAVVVLLVGILMAAAPAQSQDRVKAATLARAGWAAVRAGRHQLAADAFEDAIRITPKDAALHYGAGLAAWMQGQSQRAQTELREALALTPEYTEASLLLGPWHRAR